MDFGKPSCIAAEIEIQLESYAGKEISLILGQEKNTLAAKDMAYKYSKIANCYEELREN